ncbi:MAG: hypothetical protein Ta2E_09580 [Mycoplasmoidaceae bacterium]|nr:MAG: hypothetical protein Ta2E_09580 [Mycoplasmoidaceae bacterium]
MEIKEKGEYFFNWGLVSGRQIKGKFHSLMSESYNAANKIQIGISYNAENNKMIIWSEGKKVECGKGQTAKRITEILNNRHFENLINQKTRGQSIITFKNSAASNFYVENYRGPMKDYLFKFSIRVKNDTLWTPAKKAIINKGDHLDPNCSCGNGRLCNILHILNNCARNGNEMNKRHNRIQGRIVEAIEKHLEIGKEKIKLNKAIKASSEDFGELQTINLEQFALLRPDIEFWLIQMKSGIEVRKLNLIEISVPFGKSVDETNEITLQRIRRGKRTKYQGLVVQITEELKKQERLGVRYEVEFHTVIVSSLGAVPNFTVTDLRGILGVNISKSTINL